VNYEIGCVGKSFKVQIGCGPPVSRPGVSSVVSTPPRPLSPRALHLAWLQCRGHLAGHLPPHPPASAARDASHRHPSPFPRTAPHSPPVFVAIALVYQPPPSLRQGVAVTPSSRRASLAPRPRGHPSLSPPNRSTVQAPVPTPRLLQVAVGMSPPPQGRLHADSTSPARTITISSSSRTVESPRSSPAKPASVSTSHPASRRRSLSSIHRRRRPTPGVPLTSPTHQIGPALRPRAPSALLARAHHRQAGIGQAAAAPAWPCRWPRFLCSGWAPSP
jgi:hypothetical protein